MIPITRIITLLMAGALCFFLFEYAQTAHQRGLAIFIAVVYVAYLAANVVLWQRMRRRM